MSGDPPTDFLGWGLKEVGDHVGLGLKESSQRNWMRRIVQGHRKSGSKSKIRKRGCDEINRQARAR